MAAVCVVRVSLTHGDESVAAVERERRSIIGSHLQEAAPRSALAGCFDKIDEHPRSETLPARAGLDCDAEELGFVVQYPSESHGQQGRQRRFAEHAMKAVGPEELTGDL